MRVNELLTILVKVNPEDPVVFPDSEYGYRNVERAWVERMTDSDYGETFRYNNIDEHQVGPTVEVVVLDEKD